MHVHLCRLSAALVPKRLTCTVDSVLQSAKTCHTCLDHTSTVAARSSPVYNSAGMSSVTGFPFQTRQVPRIRTLQTWLGTPIGSEVQILSFATTSFS